MPNLLHYKSFHTSFGIGVVSIGVLVGIAGSRLFEPRESVPVGIYLVLIVAIVLLLVRIKIISLVLLCICAIALGYMRGSDMMLAQERLRSLSGQELYLTGIIAEDPQHEENQEVRFILNNIARDGVGYVGTVWADSRDAPEIGRGDQVVVRGEAKPGFGTHQLTMGYAEILNVIPSNDPITQLRDEFARGVRSVVVEPSASLGIGFVIGQKSTLSSELEEQLRIVGLTHLIVASGYNLTILMRFAKRLFEAHSKFLVMSTSIALMTGFVAVSGASPSMVRASAVAGLSLAAWYYGRRFHPVLLLLYVAAATAMYQPMYVWADLGWWLSFLAFFGVLVVSPLILNMRYKTNKPSPVIQIASESFAAQIMTLPLLLVVFGSLPTLAIVANILSAPLIPFAMLLTFLAGVSAMIIPGIGFVVGLAAEVLLSYFVAIVRFLSSPSWSQFDVNITWQVMVGMYVTAIAISAILWRKLHYNFRSSSIID